MLSNLNFQFEVALGGDSGVAGDCGVAGKFGVAASKLLIVERPVLIDGRDVSNGVDPYWAGSSTAILRLAKILGS